MRLRQWIAQRLRTTSLVMVLFSAGVVGIPAQQVEPPTRVAIVGSVRDTVSGSPVRLATVRLAGTSISVLTSDAGRFRITVPSGPIDLDVRQIGFLPTRAHVFAGEGVGSLTIYLHRAAVELTPIVVTDVDEDADRIIRAAIARKHAIFTAIHDYSYRAYVKFAVRDLAKPPDSAASVLLLTETLSETYWEPPDRYQETILSRRQTKNLKANKNLVTVGEIANFHGERIELRQFSVVSPIADDAPSHYWYRILDTLDVDHRRVIRLAIKPKNEATPLFAGTVDIVDSTWDLVGVDLGFNDAVHFTALRNLRYRQRFREVATARWMPYEIEFTGNLHLALPVPRMPRDLAFQHVAELSDFQFDQGHRPGDLAEVRVVVAANADRPDSVGWAQASRAFPLTAAEAAAWPRIDSTHQGPPGFVTIVRRGVALGSRVLNDPDFFHFNRVEGAYAGVGGTWRDTPNLNLRARLGYATGSNTTEYLIGGKVRLSPQRRLWIGLEYHDAVVTRPTFVSGSYNATVRALLFRVDPLDYYTERGTTVSLDTKLLDFTDLSVKYDDYVQSSLVAVSDYSVFPAHRTQRSNAPITPGRLRTLSVIVSYDSRPMRRLPLRDERLQPDTWTRLSLSAEIAAPGIIPNDFAYRRYTLQFQSRRRVFGLGITTLNIVAGTSSGALPPQRYFTVDFGPRALTYQGTSINTLGDTNFAGNRAAMFAVEHDFDRRLFAKSHLPLIEHLPFTFSVHAGAFWTTFVDHQPQPADSLLRTAPRGFGEVGFGLGNLTPFLSPFNLATHFSWSTSKDLPPGRRFRFGVVVFEQ